MTSGAARLQRPRSAGRALAMTLLVGAAGAGLAFLATRQAWAYVKTTPPRPLPASTIGVTGAALVPYADALILAGLASLAAVVATRRAWRRLSGLVLAALGIALAVSAFTVSRAGAIAAAATSTGGLASNPGAGSVTQGSGATSTVPDVAGTTPHVDLNAVGWQAVVVLGAIGMVAAGLIVVMKAARLAVMSSRYDAPAGSGPARSYPAGHPSAEPQPAGHPADSASIWEALSRGDDPTSGGSMAAGA